MVPTLDSAAVVRPKFGERRSGDAAFVVEIEGGILAAIVDVLGHGDEAGALAVEIQQFILRRATAKVAELLNDLNARIRGTRGAAVGLCAVESASGRLRYAGIGNTRIRRFGRTETRLVSRDGVVGGTMRSPTEATLQLEDGDVVVLYTDGVKSQFKPQEYAWFRTGTADWVAATILHRFGKSHDDASCLVLRYRR